VDFFEEFATAEMSTKHQDWQIRQRAVEHPAVVAVGPPKLILVELSFVLFMVLNEFPRIPQNMRCLPVP
jgi:hypothetical protein